MLRPILAQSPEGLVTISFRSKARTWEARLPRSIQRSSTWSNCQQLSNPESAFSESSLAAFGINKPTFSAYTCRHLTNKAETFGLIKHFSFQDAVSKSKPLNESHHLSCHKRHLQKRGDILSAGHLDMWLLPLHTASLSLWCCRTDIETNEVLSIGYAPSVCEQYTAISDEWFHDFIHTALVKTDFNLREYHG